MSISLSCNISSLQLFHHTLCWIGFLNDLDLPARWHSWGHCLWVSSGHLLGVTTVALASVYNQPTHKKGQNINFPLKTYWLIVFFLMKLKLTMVTYHLNIYYLFVFVGKIMLTLTSVILCSLQWASINTCCMWTKSSCSVSTGITHIITPSGALKDRHKIINCPCTNTFKSKK